MAELNFYWRMGDYALQACPKHLARLDDEDTNETINFIKYFIYNGLECCYSIGYFWWDEHEPCWEFKFVGERFTDIPKEDIVPIFEMLKSAYNTLTEWKAREMGG